MSDDPRFDQLVRLMIETAQSHHAATGGENPNWAAWYAKSAVERLNDLLGSKQSAEDLKGWFVEADRRYNSELQNESWPKAYASWLMEDFG